MRHKADKSAELSTLGEQSAARGTMTEYRVRCSRRARQTNVSGYENINLRRWQLVHQPVCSGSSVQASRRPLAAHFSNSDLSPNDFGSALDSSRYLKSLRRRQFQGVEVETSSAAVSAFLRCREHESLFWSGGAADRGRCHSRRGIDIPMLEGERSVVERSLRPFFRSNTHGTVRR
jgi:hypothetical protein